MGELDKLNELDRLEFLRIHEKDPASRNRKDNLFLETCGVDARAYDRERLGAELAVGRRATGDVFCEGGRYTFSSSIGDFQLPPEMVPEEIRNYTGPKKRIQMMAVIKTNPAQNQLTSLKLERLYI